MSKYALRNPVELREFLGRTEQLGDVEPHPELGCQFVDVHETETARTQRGPKDQVFIDLAPGGRSPFVTFAGQKRPGKRAYIWPLRGRSYGVVHRANGTVVAQVLDTEIEGQDKLVTLLPGDSFGLVNPTERRSVVRDEFYPHFVEEDEEPVSLEIETILLATCGLAMAAEARRVALALA